MPDLFDKDYSLPSEFLILLFLLSIIIFGRYILLSLGYYKFVYSYLQSVFPSRIISKAYPKSQQRKEIMWSAISSVIFGLIGVLMIIAWQNEWTSLYLDWSAYPAWYIPISFIGAMLIHETYYYWLHRWMHAYPMLYRKIHKVHHDSISTSVWTSFSFHPLESFLQAIIIPIIVFILPMHWTVLVVLLILMTITAIINHAGVEIYPASWRQNFVMKWIIGSTHHDLHHRRFTKNFGLYFTFWDLLMGTESDEFDDRWNNVFKKN